MIRNKISLLYFSCIAFCGNAQIKKDTVAPQTIDTIVIKKTLINAEKTIYYINKERFIKNIRISEAISTIPYVTIGNDKSIFYKGNKIESILINGIKSSVTEFNVIPVETILNIEVIYSAIDLSSGENKLTLNIKTKSKPGIKGYLDISPASFQEFFYEGMGINMQYKKTFISFTHSNLWNSNSGNIDQIYLSNISNLKTKRILFQPFNSLTLSHDLGEKQSINLKFLYSGVKENIESKDNENDIFNIMDMNSYNINLLYDWTFGRYTFKVNSDYIINQNSYLGKSSTQNASDQIFKEFALSSFISKKIKKGNIGLAFVYTNRSFNSQNNNDGIEEKNIQEQSIYNIILSSTYSLADNLSFSTNIRYQIYKDYFVTDQVFLPYVKVLQKFDKLLNIEAVYRKKVYRPNIYSLSGGIYQEVNGSITYTNPNLRFQSADLYEVSFSPTIKKGNITFGMTYEKIRNQIRTERSITNFTLINNIINGDSEETGVNISFSYPFYKDFDFNTFYKYVISNNYYENKNLKGNYHIYGVSLNGKVFKDYNIIINSNYRNRIYDANFYTELKPDLSITISRNFLNDLIYSSLEFRNILDNDARRSYSIYDGNNNALNNISYFNSRLLLLTISLNFGKNFEKQGKFINNINNDLLPK